jgi:hypothetical protein
MQDGTGHHLELILPTPVRRDYARIACRNFPERLHP